MWQGAAGCPLRAELALPATGMSSPSQSACRRSSRTILAPSRLISDSLDATFSQMEQTTMRFSRVYTSAVLSDIQFPRYCR